MQHFRRHRGNILDLHCWLGCSYQSASRSSVLESIVRILGFRWHQLQLGFQHNMFFRQQHRFEWLRTSIDHSIIWQCSSFNLLRLICILFVHLGKRLLVEHSGQCTRHRVVCNSVQHNLQWLIRSIPSRVGIVRILMGNMIDLRQYIFLSIRNMIGRLFHSIRFLFCNLRKLGTRRVQELHHNSVLCIFRLGC